MIGWESSGYSLERLWRRSKLKEMGKEQFRKVELECYRPRPRRSDMKWATNEEQCFSRTKND
jgi:hypothetical protein